jgi:hypothetical protein
MRPMSSRTPYAPRACNICRQKWVLDIRLAIYLPHISLWLDRKIKCVGERPAICQTQDKINQLLTYISLLESRLEQCRLRHGGLESDHLHARPNLGPPQDGEFSEWEFGDVQDEADDMRNFHVSAVLLWFALNQ